MSAEWPKRVAEMVESEIPDGHGFVILTQPVSDAPKIYTNISSNMTKPAAYRLLSSFVHQLSLDRAYNPEGV